ncbi:MAG: GAF domain-containing protein [Candidatus Ornithospirochaeta sp.]
MFSLGLNGNRREDEKAVLDYLRASIFPEEDTMDLYRDLANASALLYWYLDNINWLGFYLARKEELVLGPFQGEPACGSISFSRGVCGKCAREKSTVVVPDVSLFPGHIACSSSSRSEMVVPLMRDGELWGVLDVDSPCLNRFSDDDKAFLEEAAAILSSSIAPGLLKSICQRD